jgi:hypothetical protein
MRRESHRKRIRWNSWRMARGGLRAAGALFPTVLMLGALALAAMVGGPVRSQPVAAEHAPDARNRLLVAVMALRDGALIADETLALSPYQRRREQDITLDIAEGQTRASIVVTLHDRGYGGVAVELALLGVSGHAWERRSFVMYPMGRNAATRTEVLRFPIVRFADDGEQLVSQSSPVELGLVLQQAPAKAP